MIKKYTAVSVLLASFLLCNSAMANSTKAESDLSREMSEINYDLLRLYNNYGSRGNACVKALSTLKVKYSESVPHVKYLTCEPDDQNIEPQPQIRW